MCKFVKKIDLYFITLIFRESNIELRELESKLRLAYINKARAAQLAENRLKKQEEKLRSEEEDRLEREVHAKLVEEELQQEKDEALKKMRYERQLDYQLEEKQEMNIRKYEEFLKEKKAIDEIIDKIKREEHQKKVQLLVNKNVEKELIRKFIESQKIWSERERERIEKQDEEIRKYLAEKEQWKEEQDRILRERRCLKNESILKLAEEIQIREQEAREKEDIMFELHQGRLRDQNRLEELMEMERHIQRRLHCVSPMITP